MINIDGSILEGGGQILRNTVAYSVILNKPIHVTNIRGIRSNPGLKPQHMMGNYCAAVMSGSKLTGNDLHSQEITLEPNVRTRCLPGNTFGIVTAGACTLVLQTILPILFHLKKKTKLHISGGTNVPFSPHIDYIRYVLVPILNRFSNARDPPLHIRLLKRGFMPKGGGHVEVEWKPFETTVPFGPIVLTDRGKVTDIKLYLSGNLKGEEVTSAFKKLVEDANADFQISYVQADIQQNAKNGAATLVAKTDTGCILAASAFSGKKTSADRMAMICTTRLVTYLDSGACVDEHLIDQLIIFMALGSGESKVKAAFPLTLHTETAIHFAQVMTGVIFKVDRLEDTSYCIVSCKGLGLL